jgi:hypothetical protein
MQRGRPHLPDGVGQEERLTVRMRPGFKATFTSMAEAKGMSVSQAHRQALALWIARERARAERTP